MVFCLCLLVSTLCAQKNKNREKKANNMVLPAFFRTPEYGYSYGVSGTSSFKTTHAHDSATRTSLIQLLGFFTTRKVNAQGINASIFFPKEKNILLLQVNHIFFPDKFWGLGSNARSSDLCNYTYETIYFTPHLKHKIAKNFYLGVIMAYEHVYRIIYTAGSTFDTIAFKGKHPYEVFAPGISLTYDTRNNSFWPDKGLFVSAQYLHFQKKLFSDFTFDKNIIDIRYFKRVHANRILAFNLYAFQTFGNTPLRDLATLGGNSNIRGIYAGRYRALKALSFITEYRFGIYKRFKGVIFGGFGNIFNTYAELNLQKNKYNIGAGLRFAFMKKENLHLRFDYGYSSRENNAFYITIGESF